MIKLYDSSNGVIIGVISEEQLAFLRQDLEEESTEDQDYYINQATVDWFESQNADPVLVGVLRRALGGREDMDIRWERAE
jgi:processive 1,2-diacylglycerol beta-glucosyltransferase